ncbi:MAG: hypothetical protein CMM85_08610 [Rhodothermaceae bacterium]|nr:hypothetical protein [Rhodothermaceae bacterium]
MPAAPADLSLDYRWSAGSMPPPHHYAVRIRLDADGAEVALRPGYAGADTPTWTVPLTPTASDREVLVTALREAGLFEADSTPRRPRHIGGSGWTLRVTAEGRSVSVPRDAVAEAGDPAAVEAAVRGLVPDAVWADLRARRQAFIAAPG